jgi:transcription antitermination factor NusB
MTRRRRARELALQLLYQNDIAGEDSLETLEQLPQRLTARHGPEIEEFSRSLLREVLGRRAEIDERLAALSEHWKLKRMSAVDRNILRLGAAEILYRSDIPPKVAINEAVELAKKYGDADSGRFVNGILDALLHSRDTGTEVNET